MNQVDILPLVEAADIIRFGRLALVENQVNGPCVILDIESIAYVLALAIHRKRFALADIIDKERDQLLGELIRAVVVRAVRHDGRQSVGIVVGSHEVIRRCLRSTIRAMRIVLCILGKQLVIKIQRPVDLIGRDVVEAFARILLGQGLPIAFSSLQKRQRAHDIRAGKSKGILNRTIDMALGCQVNHTVDLHLLHQGIDPLKIADIGLHEAVVRFVFDIAEILQITRIGQYIEIHDPIIGVLAHHKAHHMGADKPGTARNEYVTLEGHG